MIKSGSIPCLPAISAKIRSFIRFKWFFSLMIAALFAVAATPPPDQQLPDAQYIRIINIIDRADALRVAGKADAAKAKYREAETALINFKAANPLFDPKTVAYRLKEVTGRVDTRPPVVIDTPAAKPKPKLEAESTGAAKAGTKLIDAGGEPRSVLRFHVKQGDKSTAIMTIKTTLDMPGATPDGKPMVIPALTMPMDLTVQNVAANGDISFEIVMGETSIADAPGALPAVVQGVKTATAGLKGLAFIGTMSNRGITKKVEAKTPPNADPQTRQMVDGIVEGMANMDIPMPQEAVGAGAKWEVKGPVKSQGVSAEQTATYQLVSVEGDHLKTTFTTTQTAANQKIKSPAMGGAQVNLLQMTVNVTGTADLDLSKVVASQLTVDTHQETSSEITVGGKQQPMAMKTDVNLTMDAK